MKKSSQSHVLITGGAGYIGSVLTGVLLDRGCQVTVLDNFLYRQNSLLDRCSSESFRVIRGDCRDARILAGPLSKADVVLPLAAIVGAPACDRDPDRARSTNLDAVRLLCKKMSSSQYLLFPTTNSGYGIGEKGKFCTEKTPLRPISLYGETKVKAESAVMDRENSISFRLATVFGISPRMRLDLLVNDFVWRAVTDRYLVVFEGHFKRNYIHVRDVARVFSHGMDNFKKMRGEVYNVGLEAANLSKLELCREIQRAVPGFVFFEAPIGEDVDKRDYIVSNAKILKTGFKPGWSLPRGIRELIGGYAILGKRDGYGNV